MYKAEGERSVRNYANTHALALMNSAMSMCTFVLVGSWIKNKSP